MTLTQASVQTVEISTTGATSTCKAPTAPNTGDAIWLKLVGTTIAAQAVFDGNGKNVEQVSAPQTFAGTTTLGANPGAGLFFFYDGTEWQELL